MFQSPSHVVIGATDLARMASFLGRLGFVETARGQIDQECAAALYGLSEATEQRVLHAPGAEAGFVRLIATPHAAPALGPFDRGAHAIDLYTTDIQRSLDLAAEAGAHSYPFAAYEVGSLTVREGKAVGPDGVYVVFIQVDKRRPSALDKDPSRLHSEVHSAVWVVESIDAVLPFWRDTVGLPVLLDATLREPGIARFMGLPRADTPVRVAVMADLAQRPLRFELIEFPEDPGLTRPGFPLRAGLHAVGFGVSSLEQAMARLDLEGFGPVVACDSPHLPGACAAAAFGSGGVRFELWEARA